MQKLGRVWARRAAIALACVGILSAASVGASYVPNMLTALMTAPSAPPAPPAQLTPAVPVFVPPAAPRMDEAPQAVASGDYLVAVGLFASLDRTVRLVYELTAAGLPALHRPFQLGSQRVQQVVLGPFAKRADAVADLQRLRLLGGYDDANVIDTPLKPSIP